jgi:hypothetical protein
VLQGSKEEKTGKFEKKTSVDISFPFLTLCVLKRSERGRVVLEEGQNIQSRTREEEEEAVTPAQLLARALWCSRFF